MRSSNQKWESAKHRTDVCRLLKTWILIALCAGQGLFLHACSGGGSSSQLVAVTSNSVPAIATAQATQTPSASNVAPVRVNMSYVLPAVNSTATQSAAQRKLQYVAPTNTQISITVTPFGGSATVYGPNSCTSAAVCNVSFTATPGPNTIAFVLTDGTNTLSRFSTTTIVQPATINTLNFTANPVVNSVVLSLASPSINAGSAASDLLTVSAKDLAGNTIVGPGQFVDNNGNAVSLTLAVTNNQAGGNGSVRIQGPSRITGPGQAAIYAQYDGGWLDNAVIDVQASRTIAGALSGTTLTTIPRAFEYAVSGNPFGIAVGSDGNIWYTGYGGGTIGRISPKGTNWTSYSCGGGCSGPSYLNVGPDGQMWYTEYFSNYISKISTSGVVTRVFSSGAQPLYVVSGPDGNMWNTNEGAQSISRVTATGSAVTFPVPGGKNVRGLGFGPDGNLWYLDTTTQAVGKMDRSGNFLATYSAPGVSTFPDVIRAGPDGNMWFTAYASDQIAKITMNGTITSYALQAGARPRGLTVGPDGYMWFTERSTHNIGRIKTDGTGFAEYGAANGITAGAAPIGITLGPDGNIWFVEYSLNKIAKFVL